MYVVCLPELDQTRTTREVNNVVTAACIWPETVTGIPHAFSAILYGKIECTPQLGLWSSLSCPTQVI